MVNGAGYFIAFATLAKNWSATLRIGKFATYFAVVLAMG